MRKIKIGDFVDGEIDCGIVIDFHKEWLFYMNSGEVFCEYVCLCKKTQKPSKFHKTKRRFKKFDVGDKVVGDNATGVIIKNIHDQWFMVKDDSDGYTYPEPRESLVKLEG